MKTFGHFGKLICQIMTCDDLKEEKKSYCLHSKKYHKSITLEWLELCQRVIAQCTKNEKIVQQ